MNMPNCLMEQRAAAFKDQTVIIAARSASNNAYHSRSVLVGPAPDAAGWRAFVRKRDTKLGDLCAELGVTRQTLYRFVGHKGEPRADVAIRY
jgi:hypothetical protein